MVHGGDPVDPEEERYEDLEDLAEEVAADRPDVRTARDALSAATKALSVLDSRDMAARTEQVSLGQVPVPGEAFGDDAANAGLDALTSLAARLTERIPADQRRHARERFLAFEFGYVDPGQNGGNADAVLSLLSKALAGQAVAGLDPKIAIVVGRLADAWRSGEGRFFERMSSRCRGLTSSGQELAEHLQLLAIVSDMRSTSGERNWLWESRQQLFDLVAQVLPGLKPGDPIDMRLLYLRISLLKRGPTPLPIPLAARVARLAIASLAAERALAAPAINQSDIQKLMSVANRMARSNATLPKRAVAVGSGTHWENVFRFGDYDLGETLRFLYDRRRGELAGDAVRQATLDAIVKPVTDALTKLSLMRRTGTVADIAKAARDAVSQLSRAQFALLGIVKGMGDLNLLKQVSVEADVLMVLVRGAGDRVISMCTCVANREPFNLGRFDAARFVALTRTNVEAARRDATRIRFVRGPTVVSVDVGTGVARLDAADTDWGRNLKTAVTLWEDAAKARRLTALQRPSPDDPKKTITWPGIVDASHGIAAAVAAARAAVAGLGDPRFGERFLDATIFEVAAWLRAAFVAQDPRFALAGFDALAAQIEASIPAVPVLADPVATWRAERARLSALMPLPLSGDFAEALTDWRTALAAPPPNSDLVAQRTWTVLLMLSNYRDVVEATVDDLKLRSEYGYLFDRIATTIAAGLRGL